MSICFIDFETCSEAPLPQCGAYKYAAHPSTQVLLTAWAIDDGEVQVVEGIMPNPCNFNGYDDLTFVAWNAQFEEQIMRNSKYWSDYWGQIEVVDAAAHARQFGLPSGLGLCAKFLTGTPLKYPGNDLIRKFCIPPFEECWGSDWNEFVDYCMQDVEVMRAIWNQLPPPTERQLQDYRANEHINSRGILIDREYATAALEYSEDEQRSASRRVKQLTGLDKYRGRKLTEWVYERLPDEHKHLMLAYTATGISFARHVRTQLLELSDLPPHVREVVELADATSAASTSKLQTMLNRTDENDSRVRGSFRYHGANTGRFSAHGLQLHNLPRGELDVDTVEWVRDLILGGVEPAAICVASGLSLLDTLKHTLRGCLVAPMGHSFVCADWSQIEARVNPWLSGHDDGKAKLDSFETGLDNYTLSAAVILGKDYSEVTDQERLIYGKVPELSLGFGGGSGALVRIAAAYNVDSAIDEPMARRIVSEWRRTNAWAVHFWKDIQSAVHQAYNQPKTLFPAGRLFYVYNPEFLGGSLICILPSERWIVYPRFGVDEDGEWGYAKAAVRPAAKATKWPRSKLWHGTFCENAVQGVAADILRDTLATLDESRFRTVAHCHDEVLLEVEDNQVEEAQAYLEGLMSEPGPSNLPLACNSWIGKVYRK